MKILVAFAATLLLVVGCEQGALAPSPTPTPDIEATIEAQVAATTIAVPTHTPAPTPTFIATPTYTPTLTPTPTVSDREVLVALYIATNGLNWADNTNWLSDSPLDEWYGVTTDSGGRVTELELSSNLLNGEIPAELGSLSNLQLLSLWGNQLSGEIPAELGNLSNLQLLTLIDNPELSGPLPGSFTSLSALIWLYLWDTQLCAPRDYAFQVWLLGVFSTGGIINCDS